MPVPPLTLVRHASPPTRLQLPLLPHNRTSSARNQAPPLVASQSLWPKAQWITQAPHQPMPQACATSRFPSLEVARVVHGPFASPDHVSTWKDYYHT